MKRVIKFRTYVPSTNEMIYCDYGIEYKNAIYFTGNEYIEGGAEPFPVDFAKGCELMQFTGLVDKNGREIYEGDIVRFIDDVTVPDNPCECITDVFWWDEYSGWALHNTHFELSFLTFDKIEVIGNIHENPELL